MDNLDTRCFKDALAETNRLAQAERTYGELPVDTQAYVLRRAQEIKTAYRTNARKHYEKQARLAKEEL